MSPEFTFTFKRIAILTLHQLLLSNCCNGLSIRGDEPIRGSQSDETNDAHEL